MGRRRRYGYNQVYRGRQGGSSFLKVLVIVLAVLLVLGLALLVVVTGRYLQFTDDGPKLVLPWLQEGVEASATPDLSDVLVTETPEPSVEPTPTPDPASQPLTALLVDPASLIDGTAPDRAARAGANALVVQVQDEEGNLAWQTAQALPHQEMNGDAALNGAVEQLARDGRFHLTARLSGFRSLWGSVYAKNTALTSGTGKLWYDSGGISWVSASDPSGQAYLSAICQELAEMGFDEIVLEHPGYPDSGRVNYIAKGDKYPKEGRDGVVRSFLENLSRQLEEAGAVLSVRVTGAPDGAAASGVTPAALTALSGRVWLSGEADIASWSSALTQAGMAEVESRLAAEEPLPADASWSGSRLLAGEG